MKHTKVAKGYFFVIASAFIFGCMPLGAKYIYSEGVSPLSLVFLRNVLALPILALLAKIQGHSLLICRKALVDVSIIGLLGCSITPILLFNSYQHLDSGTATVFHFIYPAVVVLGEIFLSKKKIQKNRLLCVLICMVGVFLFYDPSKLPDLRGSALALASGIAYAIYILLLSSFQHQDVSGFKLSFYISLICSISMLFVCLSTKQLSLPLSVQGWALCILFSLALCVGAVVLFQEGTRIIGGDRASILSTVEPITSIVVGAFIFHETVTFRTAAGSLFVILASILIAYFDTHTDQTTSKLLKQ